MNVVDETDKFIDHYHKTYQESLWDIETQTHIQNAILKKLNNYISAGLIKSHNLTEIDFLGDEIKFKMLLPDDTEVEYQRWLNISSYHGRTSPEQ